MTHRSDHEQETNGVADKPREADQGPADEDHDAIEQLAGRKLAGCEAILSFGQHAQANPPDDKRTHPAYDDQDQQRQEKADLLCHHDEHGDLYRQTEQKAEEQHKARVPACGALASSWVVTGPVLEPIT